MIDGEPTKGAILMKKFVRVIAFMLLLSILCPAALAADTLPPPVAIPTTQVEPPPEIQKVLDIAYAQWLEVDGKNITDVNKYTEWRGKGYKFQWCAGFVTWCMMEASIPMMTMADFQAAAKKSDDGLVHMEGLYHCKEAGQGKLLNAYQLMERTTMVPQKGFVVIYGTSWNEAVHAALVYDVEELGDGKFRITTLEGNVKNGKTPNSITMYIRDYDMNAAVNTNQKKSTNLTQVPEAERTVEEAEYILMEGPPTSGYKSQMYYVYRFLMPWVPGDPALTTPDPTAEPTPEPTAEPTPAPEVFPCQGKEGKCPYITRAQDDSFCRKCDRNDNGVEDSKE
jgi:hypothetical protein